MAEMRSSSRSTTSRSTWSGDAPGYTMPMKTTGASMSGNSSVWSRASAAMPNTASAIVTTTVMIGRRIAKSEMNIPIVRLASGGALDVEAGRGGEWGVGGDGQCRSGRTHPRPPTPHQSQHQPQHVHEPLHVPLVVVQVRRHADRVAAHAHEHPRLGEALGEAAGKTARQLHADDVRDSRRVGRH